MYLITIISIIIIITTVASTLIAKNDVLSVNSIDIFLIGIIMSESGLSL